MEAEIQRLMALTGMDYVQAYYHVSARRRLANATFRRVYHA